MIYIKIDSEQHVYYQHGNPSQLGLDNDEFLKNGYFVEEVPFPPHKEDYDSFVHYDPSKKEFYFVYKKDNLTVYERLDKYKQENEQLKKQNKVLEERVDFQEDLLTEIVMLVYS